MKKALLIAGMLLCAFLFACNNTGVEPRDIVLGFDSQVAYFTGEKNLLPIRGVLPEPGDIYEEANITLSADKAVKLRLLAVIEDGQAIDKLMIAINGNELGQLISDLVLYESITVEMSTVVNVKIYLAADAEASKSSGKQLSFTLQLNYQE